DPPPQVPRGLRAHAEDRGPAGPARHPIPGVRDPARVRHRVRARLRRAVPEPALRRDPQAGRVRGGLAEPGHSKITLGSEKSPVLPSSRGGGGPPFVAARPLVRVKEFSDATATRIPASADIPRPLP